jgi:hypothetical protein
VGKEVGIYGHYDNEFYHNARDSGWLLRLRGGGEIKQAGFQQHCIGGCQVFVLLH